MKLDWYTKMVYHEDRRVAYHMFKTNRFEGGFCATGAYTDICIEDKETGDLLGFNVRLGGADKDVAGKMKALTEDILDKIAADVRLSNEFSYCDYARRYGLKYERQRQKKPDGYKKTGNSLGSLWKRTTAKQRKGK